MVLVGGLRPLGEESEEARYAIPPDIGFVELPYYPSLTSPAAVLSVASLRRFWRALDGVDAVWVFAPHPLAIAFALMAALRRRRVVLGVRQDSVAYIRARHPSRRALHSAARFLEALFRALARRFDVVTVGPELGRNYARAKRRLEIVVSLVGKDDVVKPNAALARDYGGELRVLSVGRIDSEKNPLLMADVCRLLNFDDRRYRLIVCGEGEMRPQLEARLDELGQADQSDVVGYVPFGPQLLDLYRNSHILLHTSFTEGLPAVLPEAFAAGLPVVAADVGGIGEAVGEAALTVPPADADACAVALRRVAGDAGLRERLVRAGYDYAARHTVEAETERLAAFLRGG